MDNINKVFDNKTKYLNNIEEQNIIKSVEENFEVLLKNKINNIKGKVKEIITTNKIFLSQIEEWKKNALEESIKNFIKQTKHINIILLGKTGVGKSSLINGLLGRNLAPEFPLYPRKTIEYYENAENKLRLWDTPGINVTNPEQILKNAKQLIKDSEQKGPDWFIHCIWYCWTGYRFEEEEDNILRELVKSYEDEKLPFIIVYTHSLDPDEVKLIEKVFQDKKYDFISVLAKDEINEDTGEVIRRKFGLKDLVEKTIYKFRNSIDSMSYYFVLNKTKETVRSKINDLNKNNLNTNNLNNSICDFYSQLLGELNVETMKLINEGLDDIINSCKNEINFNHNISNYISKCEQELFQDFDLTNEIKNFIIDSLKKEIQLRFEKAKEQFFEKKLNEQIYTSYTSIIISFSDSIITESLYKIKAILIPKLRKEIENSPNFSSMFKIKRPKTPFPHFSFNQK